MTDEDIIGYALDLLDPDDRAAVEAQLSANPDTAVQLDRVRTTLLPLEADRDDDPPPPALATRTVSRLAALLVEPSTPVAHASGSPAEPPTTPRSYPYTDRPEPRYLGGRFRADVIVAAGISLVAVGLALSFVTRARQASDLLACQNNLRTLYAGMVGYADTHAGRLPQIGADPYPTAGSFVQALADAGQCPPGFRAVCPAVGVQPDLPRDALPPASQMAQVTYTFPLGHRTPSGVVQGLWRSSDPYEENDLMPVGADYPVAATAPSAGPTSPHGWGHNVLYFSGNVRFATTSDVGVNGDDIFRNQLGQVAAGVNRVDTVLGRPADRP
jgi:hypothetical protein